MNVVDTRLAELGITLPSPAAPIANYVPYVITGNLLVISGQISRSDARPAAEAAGQCLEQLRT